MRDRSLKAFNVVIGRAVGDGFTISLAQDIHGKGLGNILLGIPLPD
ncbi:AtuA-related protein [Plastoroseomonas hellenica]